MIVALLLLAAPVEELDCSEVHGQQLANLCAIGDYTDADVEMNVQWRLTANAMPRRDREIDRQVDHEPGNYETLLAAQRAWLTYRSQQCLVRSFEGRGGTLAPWLEATCLTELTKARTKQLKELVEGEK